MMTKFSSNQSLKLNTHIIQRPLTFLKDLKNMNHSPNQIAMEENEKSERIYKKLRRARYVEKCDSLFDTAKDTNRGQLSNNFHANQLCKLEDFVEELLSDDTIPFVRYVWLFGDCQYDRSPLAKKYFKDIPHFYNTVNMLSSNYEYSERITTFMACCHSLDLTIEWLNWLYQLPYLTSTFPPHGEVSAADIFNKLVAEIRCYWQANKMQAKLNARKQDAERRYGEYCRYADSMFVNRAKLLVLRVDLFYKKETLTDNDIFNITQDFDHLLENKRGNQIFNFKMGYIAKLEYGVEKGLHWHVLFFFDGSERKNSSHIHLTQAIGEYWVHTITKGRGDYWNVNDRAKDFEALGRLGIGTIKWTDEALRSNLKGIVIDYLCKTDQFIRVKCGVKVRLLRRGNFPDVPLKKRGRPRQGEGKRPFLLGEFGDNMNAENPM